MKQEEKYNTILQLKDEINARLSRGDTVSNIADLTRYLSQNQAYLRLYRSDHQLSLLLCFLQIWQEESQMLPSLGISDTVFYRVDSLDALEQKQQKIEYYGLRIENGIPESCCREMMDSLLEQKISGIAFGTILKSYTKNIRENMLVTAQELKRRLDLPNAILLLQFAVKEYPHDETLLLETADCWLQGQQYEKAYEVLSEIENITPEMQELINELRQVTTHD